MRLPGQTSQTGAVQARVVAADGRPLDNASVEPAVAPTAPYPRVTRTGQAGDYRINFITPGTYVVTVRLIGYQPVAYSGVTIGAAEVQTLDVVLTPSRTALDTLSVIASVPLINQRTTEFTTTLSARERERLPTARDANALIDFVPGARAGQVFGGSTDQANLYQLDGVTVNQPGYGGSFLLPNIDWIEDFKVIGLGAGAEYGNFQGGLVNIVTKSGSNTRQAQVRTFFENRALYASIVIAFERGAEQAARVEVNAEVRGPLVRDRLYFFMSGLETFASQRLVDFRQTVRGRITWLPTTIDRHEQKYYGKLTWQASPRDIINASVGLDRLSRERVGLNGYDDIDATSRGRSPAAFYQANWQRTIGEQSFRGQGSGYFGADDELPYNGALQPAIRLLDAQWSPQYVNSLFTRTNHRQEPRRQSRPLREHRRPAAPVQAGRRLRYRRLAGAAHA